MSVKALKNIVHDALAEMKAIDVVDIDVEGKSSVTDLMVVATGNSNRHVKSCADIVVEKAKENGFTPIGVEGRDESQWVLVDLGDIVVHVFQAEMRDFYSIEDLWKVERGKEFKADAE